MNFIFLMDPLGTVVMKKDTTFILMLEAYRRKHKVFFLPEGGISRDEDKLFFHVTEVQPQRNPHQPFIEKKKIVLSEDAVDVVFVRTDPPFDEEYMMHTWMLDLLPKRIPVINNPTGIRTVNEKIWASQFVSFIPPTLISRQKEDLFKFIAKEKDVIAKPTNAFGGHAVFHIHKKDTNSSVILESLTNRWTKEIILQKYVPESKKGDKRILLLDGEILGAVLRVASKGEHRNNFFAGGKPFSTVITERDLEIVHTLKPYLKKLGLYFVGIDVIGDYLIEVNVTSPTCLQEMNQLYDDKLERKVIDFAERLVKNNG